MYICNDVCVCGSIHTYTDVSIMVYLQFLSLVQRTVVWDTGMGCLRSPISINTYSYMCKKDAFAGLMYIYIYIFIYLEIETYSCRYLRVYVYIYIYIYVCT